MASDRLDNNHRLAPEKGSYLAPETEAGRQEHTLGGYVLGALREMASLGHEGPAELKRLRASENDRMAGIAADTAAFLPALKWMGAGVVRAVLLSDPHRSLSANGTSFARNFAEGAALNKIGEMGAPEGVLSRIFKARLGGGLAAEGASHLTVGFAMGSARTAFNPASWTDKSGHLSIGKGLQQVTESGMIGSLVNIPAGFAGNWISKSAGLAAAEGRIPASAGGLISGWGSGYASGSVFGGVDALMVGKSWQQVFALANEGGWSGGFSGAFLHGYATRRAHVPDIKLDLAIDRKAHIRTADSLPMMVASDQQPAAAGGSERKAESPRFENLNIVPPQYDQKLLELSSRLRVRDAVESMSHFKVLQAGQEFSNFAEFTKMHLENRETQVRVYTVEGLQTEIVIPTTYASGLDEIRQLRLKSETAITPQSTLQEISGIHNAKLALKAHPYANRMLPEEFIPLIEELPDRSMIKKFYLLDHSNPYDPWFQKVYNTVGFKSAASATDTGVVSFFRKSKDTPNRALPTRGEVAHEWAHLLKFCDKQASENFDLAAQLESEAHKGHFARPYAGTKPLSSTPHEENWAVHLGEYFLAPDADVFIGTAGAMPVRAAVMGRSLSQALANVPVEARSPFHEQYVQRADYLKEHVLPQAQAKLIEHLWGADPKDSLAAAKLLGYLGNGSHLEQLVDIACRAEDSRLALAAFKSAVSVTSGRRQQIDALLAMSVPESTVRNFAIPALDRLEPAYADYASWVGNPYRAEGMVELIRRMPDERGRQLAIEQALLLAQSARDVTPLIDMIRLDNVPLEAKVRAFNAANDMLRTKPDQQVALAMHVLMLHRDLRLRALDILSHFPEPKVIERIGHYVNDRNPQVASRARAIVDYADKRTVMLRLTSQLNASDSDQRLTAIRRLGRLNEVEAIIPLLRVAVNANEVIRQEIKAALSNFTVNVVTFQARELSRQEPALANGLRQFLYQKS